MSEATNIQVGDLRIDTANRLVWIGDDRLHFARREFELMLLLAMNPGKVFTKEALTEHLFGRRVDPEVKVIDVFITHMRKMMAATAGAHLIETVWGEGYRLRTPEPAAD